MALPSSGRLSLSDIVGEFGGVAPHKLSEYYGQGNVPASGRLSVSDFYGESAFTATHSMTIQSNQNIYGSSPGSITPTTLLNGQVTNINIDTAGNGGGNAVDSLILGNYQGLNLAGKTMEIQFGDGAFFRFTNLPAPSTELASSNPVSGFTNYMLGRVNQAVEMAITIIN